MDKQAQIECGLLTPEILKRHAVLEGAGLYCCGPPAMQEHVSGVLDALGMDRARMQTESFSYRTRYSR
jgi:ferredoxin-NADP reductase